MEDNLDETEPQRSVNRVVLVAALACALIAIIAFQSSRSSGSEVVLDVAENDRASADEDNHGRDSTDQDSTDTENGTSAGGDEASPTPMPIATDDAMGDDANGTPETDTDLDLVSATGFAIFDGIDDYVNLGPITVDGSAITIEAWVFAQQLANCPTVDCRIISKATGVNETQHEWMLSTFDVDGVARLRFRVRTNGVTTTVVATSGDLSDAVWTHVAASYDGETVRLFVNGTVAGEQAVSGELDADPTLDAWIGGSPPSATERPWHGAIDDVRIWNRARTEAEILVAMERPLTGDERGLLAYYQFEQDSFAKNTADGSSATLGATEQRDASDPIGASRHETMLAGIAAEPQPTAPAEPLSSAPGAPPALAGPIPNGWDEAAATGDIWTIRGWYLENTGFEACYDEDRGRNLTFEDLTLIEGQHLTEPNTEIYGAYITGKLTLLADNISIRCSMVDVSSTTYGLDASGFGFVAGRNWTVENVSFRNSDYDPVANNHQAQTLRPMFMNTPGTARFNQMLHGYSSGYDSYNASNQLWEYNFTDQIVRAPGSHNTGFGIRSLNDDQLTGLTVRRNLVLDGTSAAFTFYANSSGLHSNLLFEENIFDLPYTTGAEYCAYTGHDGGGGYRRENVVWRNNIWGTTTSAVCGNSGPNVGIDGLGDPERSTNNRFIDGRPID